MTTVTPDAAVKFTDFQLALDMADRGWLETTYYQMGSDYRGSLTYLLSYMSQMGGWSILDNGLHTAADPTDFLRLGYSSSLSSWASVNSGTRESGYGYWFPSANNDGAAGGCCAAIRTHATIVTRDPIFGEIAYGGVLTRIGRSVSVIPRDGLRVRFHVVRGAQRLHLELDHDGFAKEQPIVVSDDLSRIAFTVENRSGGTHATALSIEGLPDARYQLTVDGKTVQTVPGGTRQLSVPVTGVAVHVTIARSR
jgi:hypothetical protein